MFNKASLKNILVSSNTNFVKSKSREEIFFFTLLIKHRREGGIFFFFSLLTKTMRDTRHYFFLAVFTFNLLWVKIWVHLQYPCLWYGAFLEPALALHES